MWSEHGVIHPEDPKKLRWDGFAAILIIYSVITVTLRIVFVLESPGGAAQIIDWIIDITFMTDMYLNTRTSFADDTGLYVVNRKRIVRAYLSGWALIDFVSTVPIDTFVGMMSGKGDPALRSTKLLRVLRLAKLFK